VFEAAKAVNNRVKAMTDLEGDGAGLMGKVFSSDKPQLILADLTTVTGRDIQDGYRLLFMGAQRAIRNPAAHEPFADVDEDETFELLGLASHLMRRLDHSSKPKLVATTSRKLTANGSVEDVRPGTDDEAAD
jgi:uncharacterized protein (TIGR02391 family)